ncbi:hypothetical protein [Nostoc sp. TCL26-01]|uniref:hypothetical protein n=1 Tax=Nostoc sp. TCL26-01 TaxID=2576904 RepID=UPI0015BE8805|nr:hypothetical protein [Nostoc sp. TCL26-01]
MLSRYGKIGQVGKQKDIIWNQILQYLRQIEKVLIRSTGLPCTQPDLQKMAQVFPNTILYT